MPDDNISDISPERLANYMIKQLKAMPEEQRLDHLERLHQDMPLVYNMVKAGLDTRGIHSFPLPPHLVRSGDPVKEPSPESKEPAPPGKLMQLIHAFKEFMAALRGGGVWAALTLCLVVCGYQAWKIDQLNQTIVDILTAARQVHAVEPTPVPAVVPLAALPEDSPPATGLPSPVNQPRDLLSKYHQMYRPQVEQRILDAEPPIRAMNQSKSTPKFQEQM